MTPYVARATGYLATLVAGQAVWQVGSAAPSGPKPVAALAEAERKSVDDVLAFPVVLPSGG